MTEKTSRLWTTVARVLFITLLFAVSLTSARAQSAETRKPGVPDTDKLIGGDSSRPFVEVEEEMRAKRAIQVLDKEYQENLERARELSFLGTSLATSYQQKNTLDREDLKKLARVEKLAKNIRNAAGGEGEEIKIEKAPNDLASALNLLESLSKSLREKVEKTPKHVISAAVIDEANVLLELIRIVRTFPPQV
jgi:predicted NAD-dependent protein-ADP-ribosyltransferase YbiA (DUF1768 family)